MPGRMCHVDGMVVNGRTVFAWPSQYQYALATFRTDTGPRMDLTLDVDDPLAGRLLEFTGRLLAAMPSRSSSPSTPRCSTPPTTSWCCARSRAAQAAPPSATSCGSCTASIRRRRGYARSWDCRCRSTWATARGRRAGWPGRWC
ncbi:hypothetical protein ACR6C2_38560 [Streptomyces sp. INA 01156]